jgi:hypothetical protein
MYIQTVVTNGGSGMSCWDAGGLTTATATPLRAPEWAYLWGPIGTGGILAVALVLYIGIIGIPRRRVHPRQTAQLFTGDFWTTPFHASAAWTFSDSWATNITAVGTLIGTLFAATGALDTVIPGYDPNPFIIMNIACGGITVSAPLLFGILYVKYSRRYPSAPANAIYQLAHCSAMSVPAGAVILVANDATITGPSGTKRADVKAGGTIPVPPGSTITLYPGTTVAIPGGTDVVLQASGELTVGTATWVAGSDLNSGQLQGSQFPVIADDRIIISGGAKISVTGVANIILPQDTPVTAPGYKRQTLSTETPVVVPPSTDLIVADMRCLIPAGALTVFGIGIDIGMVAILAGYFSHANFAGHVAAWVISAVAALGLIVYAATAMRALADPMPGSSLSGRSGTSFTL